MIDKKPHTRRGSWSGWRNEWRVQNVVVVGLDHLSWWNRQALKTQILN